VLGSLSLACGELSRGSSTLETETCIAVDPSNPNRVAIFSAHPPKGLLKVTSADGGQTWSAAAIIANGSDSLPTCDEGDPWASFDQYGNLFLVYINSFDTVPLLVSTDGGANFTQAASFGGAFVDRPSVVTGPGQSGNGSVWVYWINGNNYDLTIAGSAVTGLGASGLSFTSYKPGCATVLPGSRFPAPTGVAVSGTGKVAMTWESAEASTDTTNRKIFVNIDTDGLGPSQPTSGCVASWTMI
jgi:hypothetical protein